MSTTAAKTKHIDELHFEHQVWSNEAKFFKDELGIYQKRLEEIAAKNSSEDVRKQVEHFQNQFYIQRQQLDVINHGINEHEAWLTKFAKENPVAIDKQKFADHAVLHDKVDTFKKLYMELKQEFNKFVATWM